MYKQFSKVWGLIVIFFILTTCESEKVTPDVTVEFSEISITKNPSGLAPLSASASTTNTPSRITISIPYGSSPLRKEFSEFNTNHEIPILGSTLINLTKYY